MPIDFSPVLWYNVDKIENKKVRQMKRLTVKIGTVEHKVANGTLTYESSTDTTITYVELAEGKMELYEARLKEAMS